MSAQEHIIYLHFRGKTHNTIYTRVHYRFHFVQFLNSPAMNIVPMPKSCLISASGCTTRLRANQNLKHFFSHSQSGSQWIHMPPSTWRPVDRYCLLIVPCQPPIRSASLSQCANSKLEMGTTELRIIETQMKDYPFRVVTVHHLDIT